MEYEQPNFPGLIWRLINFDSYRRIPKHFGFAMAYSFPFIATPTITPRMCIKVSNHTNAHQNISDVYKNPSYQLIPIHLGFALAYNFPFIATHTKTRQICIQLSMHTSAYQNTWDAYQRILKYLRCISTRTKIPRMCI